ncbi:hypothetical protein [Paenibacillus koleovorans]|uniref:hypothetical protein n=1 Tax=Paenibacillus koleovorans TaxID=121608 RepID=UPI000FD787BD|nr:hypothetical protein [Paenibacillus koleovorans]
MTAILAIMAEDTLLLPAALFALLLGAGGAALPAVLRFMATHRLTAPNYAQIPIPTGLGLFVWLLHIALLALLAAVNSQASAPAAPRELLAAYTPYAAAISLVFVVGWLDDTVGDRQVKGLRGHWAKWRRDGTVTTGLLKVAGITAAALIATATVTTAPLASPSPPASSGLSASLAGAGTTLLQAALVALTANAFNLLDLRPGRALKLFLALTAALLLAALLLPAATFLGVPLVLLLPSVAAALLLLPGDLRARHMLGDAGANALGFAAGMAMTAILPGYGQGMAVVALLGLHYYAEKRSISGWIERHRLARWFDRLGRA